MAADTTSSVFGLKTERVSTILVSVWLAAVTLSLVDTDWLGTLGFAHILLFAVSAAVFAAIRGTQEASAVDFIRFPLTTFVPVFLVVYCAHQYISV